MDLDLNTLGASAAGAGTIGSIIIWQVKRALKKLDVIEDRLHQYELKMAKEEGIYDGKMQLIWRDIDTGKHKIAKMMASNDKIWQTLTHLAEKSGLPVTRISDLIEDSLKK